MALGTRQALIASLAGLAVTSMPWSFSQDIVLNRDAGVSGIGNAVKVIIFMGAVGLAFYGRSQAVPLLPIQRVFLLYGGVGLVTAVLSAAPSTDGLVRAIRLLVVVFALHWISTGLGVRSIARTLTVVASLFAFSALIGRLSGWGISNSRLYGFAPYLHPNLLASISSVGIVLAFYLWVRSNMGTAVASVLIAPSAVALYLTGSRTALASMVLGVFLIVAVAFVTGKSRAVGACWVGAATGVGVLWVEALTYLNPLGFVGNAITRDGNADVDLTLTGRTEGWTIALDSHQGSVDYLIGDGLNVKSVSRTIGTMVRDQGIDNAWIAAFVAVGVVGLLLLVVASIMLLIEGFMARSLVAVALMVTTLSASWTESSLSDLSFVLIAVLSVVASVAHSARLGNAVHQEGPSTVPSVSDTVHA